MAAGAGKGEEREASTVIERVHLRTLCLQGAMDLALGEQLQCHQEAGNDRDCYAGFVDDTGLK